MLLTFISVVGDKQYTYSPNKQLVFRDRLLARLKKHSGSLSVYFPKLLLTNSATVRDISLPLSILG